MKFPLNLKIHPIESLINSLMKKGGVEFTITFKEPWNNEFSKN